MKYAKCQQFHSQEQEFQRYLRKRQSDAVSGILRFALFDKFAFKAFKLPTFFEWTINRLRTNIY